MNTLKPYLKFIPECYFILSAVYYWIMTSSLFNPFALILLVALAVLMFFKNKGLGVLLSILFILINLYMFLALLSEYRKFHEPSQAAHDLIVYGSIYLGLNLLMSMVMLIKYALMESPQRPVRQPAS
jgi:hypothetical protein